MDDRLDDAPVATAQSTAHRIWEMDIHLLDERKAIHALQALLDSTVFRFATILHPDIKLGEHIDHKQVRIRSLDHLDLTKEFPGSGHGPFNQLEIFLPYVGPFLADLSGQSAEAADAVAAVEDDAFFDGEDVFFNGLDHGGVG